MNFNGQMKEDINLLKLKKAAARVKKSCLILMT